MVFLLNRAIILTLGVNFLAKSMIQAMVASFPTEASVTLLTKPSNIYICNIVTSTLNFSDPAT